MPKVGSKHFSYTPKGQKQAAAFAQRTGKRVEQKPPVQKKRK